MKTKTKLFANVLISAPILCCWIYLSTFAAHASQDPPGCSANNLNVNIGVKANNVTNGTLVTWTVSIQNPNLPASCAVTLGPEGLFFICPGPDGNPTGSRTTLIPGGTTIQPGYGLETFEIQCLVNVSGQSAEGKVSAPGSVVHKNPLQDDPANVDKSISLNVFRPCLRMGSTCVSAVNPTGNSVNVTYTGTLTNCGNVFLQQVVVYADQPSPGTLVFGPITLLAGARTNFTATYTRTDNLCGPFPVSLSASGTAPLDVATTVSATANSQCAISYVPGIRVTTFCPPAPVEPGGYMTVSGVVSNSGNIALKNVIVENNRPVAATVLLGPITLGVGEAVAYSGAYAVPFDSCPPYSHTVEAEGTPICGTQLVSSQVTISCPGTNSPAILVTKVCPPNPVAPGGTLTYTGAVTNTGNVTLTNVIVVSDKPAPNTRIFGPDTLAPGEGDTFTSSYSVPLDGCGPYTSTLVASGRDRCFSRGVTNSTTVSCPGTSTAGIRVTKVCPPTLVQPGGTLSYSGMVTNTGNVTLNNVTVYNGSTVVYGPATLAPKAKANFTGSYTVPLDSCGPYVDTLYAQGISLCNETVTDSVSVPCPGTNTPVIRVTKACPANPVQPGQTLVYTGTVTNAGNVTLTNVMVVNNMPVANTIVFGPTDLSPGAGASFSGAYAVPPDSCGPYSDTVVASGADKCFGRVVSASATSSCPGVNNPGVTITQECPATATPIGGTLTFSSTVFNTGNITLTEITVVNDRPGAGTPVFHAESLAPGTSTNFLASFAVPANHDACSIANTLVVTARNKCSSAILTNSVTKVCPVVPAPGIKVTKNCPATPVAPGGTLTFTGTVLNGGNVTLSNVSVVVNRPNPGTVVYAAASLAPGTIATFTGSYTAPLDDCSVTDTLSVTAVDRCGNTVSDSTTATCPIATSPMLTIGRTCPVAAVAPGSEMGVYGWITNRGNITLTNVTVVVDRPAANTRIFGPVNLAPGEFAGFVGSFTVPTNLGACSMTSTCTVRGNDKCTGGTVIASSVATCPVTTSPKIVVAKLCPPNAVAPGSQLVFTGWVTNTGNIALTNVVVVNTMPVTNTLVFRTELLMPGQATNFTASYTAPGNCCSVCDLLTATGQDQCTGAVVKDTSSAICPVLFTPAIKITKVCPTVGAVPGEPLRYSGTVSNAGNITLAEVSVYNSMTGAQNPILGLSALAPGEVQAFTGSFNVPVDFCEPDTVTVNAKSICGEVAVSDSVTSQCTVITTPGIAIMGVGPTQPLVHGQPVTFTGTVLNIGNVTLRNIMVVNSMPAANTAVMGPVTLAPGQSTNFVQTYTAPWQCNCCELVNTFTAKGEDRCLLRQVSAASTVVSKYLTHPQVVVALECPSGGTVGQTVNVTGYVMNSSDISLTNVTVVELKSDGSTRLVGPITLLRGEMQEFTVSYTAGKSVTVVATATDACTGGVVTDQDRCGSPVPAPVINTPVVYRGEGVVLTWTSMPGVTYRVQSTSSLVGAAWVDEPGDVVATGNTCTKNLSILPGVARYYRVLGFWAAP